MWKMQYRARLWITSVTRRWCSSWLINHRCQKWSKILKKFFFQKCHVQQNVLNGKMYVVGVKNDDLFQRVKSGQNWAKFCRLTLIVVIPHGGVGALPPPTISIPAVGDTLLPFANRLLSTADKIYAEQPSAMAGVSWHGLSGLIASFGPGAVTGATFVVVGHPFDTLKVWQQTNSRSHWSPRLLYRGIAFPLSRCPLFVVPRATQQLTRPDLFVTVVHSHREKSLGSQMVGLGMGAGAPRKLAYECG